MTKTPLNQLDNFSAGLSGSSTRLRGSSLAGQAEIVARHPTVFIPTWRTQIGPAAIAAGLLALFLFGLWDLGFSVSMLLRGSDQLWVILGVMLPPNPETWDRVLLYLGSLAETLGIAFLGTLLGALMAFPVGFLAAKNVVANFILHVATRRVFDCIRGVDMLIWALIWINVVGLGPFAGVLAIACADFGAFGKLFSEAIEAADRKPVEGILSSGGSWLETIRFGVLPQVLPVITSQVLYFFESNTRSATIIGIVGAGGIGLHLSEMIRTVEWQQVSFIILLMLITVSIIDQISTRLRMAIIGPRAI
jgi:phosphonate transport system permease protein